MNQFVENCGDDRTNPLLNYVHRYADDKSNWQDQYLAQRGGRGDEQFLGVPHGPRPLPPGVREQRMVAGFFNPREFDRFEGLGPNARPEYFPSRQTPPPQAFDDYVRGYHNELMDPLDFVEQGDPIDKHRNLQVGRPLPLRHDVDSLNLHALNISSEADEHQVPVGHWSKEAMEQRNAEWVKDFADDQSGAEFEAIWRHPPQPRPQLHPPPGAQTWIEEFPDENYEEVYEEVRQRNEGSQWSDEFIEQEEKQQFQEEDDSWKELANQVRQLPDAKLQASQFMHFVNKMSRGELKVDADGKLVELTEGQKFADEFLANQPIPVRWENEFAEGDEASWDFEFGRGNWRGEEQELIDEYTEIWNEQQKYSFHDDNAFASDPEALNKGLELFKKGDLPQAIQALEAAVQQHPDNSLAWTKLGIAQAENDKDILAIKALKQAIAVDPSNLEAYMAITVSYTNEFQMKDAINSLWQWMHKNPKYTQFMAANDIGLLEGALDENHKRVTQLLINAAKQAPPDQLDPDVHTALGLLYNLSFEYDKAIGCFRAALTKRPDEYQLWNKLGATTANSPQGKERAAEAIDAYFRALHYKPTYTRARCNLGISYVSTNNFPEAAKCFLGALTINNSGHLWDNLRSALTSMERYDLVNLTMKQDPEAFRNEFDF